MAVLPILYVLAFIFLIATCYNKELKKRHVTAKFVNSIGFISVATAAYIISGNKFYFYMLPAFILCLIGDLFLAVEDSNGGKKYFVFGLLSFLTGHIVFVLAFMKIAPLTLYDFIIPVTAVVITYFLVRMKSMNVGKMKVYVLIYSFFIAMLLSKALSIVLFKGMTIGNMLLLIGSILFFVSDAIILFLYFYEKKHYLVKFFNLLTYYLGMFLIALSLLY